MTADKLWHIVKNTENSSSFAEHINNISNQKQEYVDIAVGYFNIEGWATIQTALKNKKKIRLLVGSQANTGLDETKTYAALLGYYKEIINSHVIGKNQYLLELFDDLLQNGDKLEIRYYSEGFLHAKLFLFRDMDNVYNSSALITSANLTKAGMEYNVELGASVRSQPEDIQELSQWFDNLWDKSVDFKPEISELVNNRLKQHSFEEVLKLIFETQTERVIHAEEEEKIRLSLESDDSWLENLKTFQIDAVKKAYLKLARHSGVILADEVGLGKTYMSGALLKRELYDYPGSKVLIIAPPSLIPTWENYLEKQGIPPSDRRVQVHKKTSSAHLYGHDDGRYKKNVNARYAKEFSLVIIDEAHQLRNEDTKTYDNIVNNFLPYLVNGTKTILATATPLNNDLSDIRSLLNIFLPDDAFSSQGIPSIESLFPKSKIIANDKTHGQMFLGLDMVMIRRTRSFIQKTYADTSNDLDFPELIIPDFDDDENIFYNRYGYSSKYKALAEDIFDHLTEKSQFLALYSPGKYLPTKTKHSTSMRLVRTTLLKSLDSSPQALISTLEKMRDKHKHAEETLRRIINGSTDYSNLRDIFPKIDLEDEELLTSLQDEDKAFMSINEDANETLHQTVEELTEYKNDSMSSEENKKELTKYLKAHQHDEELTFKLREFARDICQDKELINSWLDRVRGETSSDKNNKLYDLLEHLTLKAENSNAKKIIVFFQSVKSLEAVAQLLKRQKIYGDKKNILIERVGTVKGVTSRSEKQEILFRFCPETSPSVDDITNKEELDILLTTDTLSEGVNLQQAKYIIHYDLPWNPMRVIQRIGRINRLGSFHQTISSYYMVPEEKIQQRIAKTWAVLKMKLELATKLLGETDVLEGAVRENIDNLTTEDLQILQAHRNSEFSSLPQALQDKLHRMGVQGEAEEKEILEITQIITEKETTLLNVQSIQEPAASMETYEEIIKLVESSNFEASPMGSYSVIKVPEENQTGVLLTVQHKHKGKHKPVVLTRWVPQYLLDKFKTVETSKADLNDFASHEIELSDYLDNYDKPWWETLGEKIDILSGNEINVKLEDKEELRKLKRAIFNIYETLQRIGNEEHKSTRKIRISPETETFLQTYPEEKLKYDHFNMVSLPQSQKMHLEKLYETINVQQNKDKIDALFRKKKYSQTKHLNAPYSETSLEIVGWILMVS